MALKVLWTHVVSGEAARQLAPPPGVEVIVELDRERARELKDWPQVIVDGGPPEELLDGAFVDRVIVPYAGLGGRLRGYLLRRPHLKVQNSHFNDGMVAQHAVALLLAVASRVPASDAALRRGDWGPAEKDTDGLGVYLRGKSCLLLGYGSIAKAAAPLLQALGLKLSAFRRRPRQGGDVPEVGPAELRAALAEADVIVSTLPLTDETRGLIGAAELAAMKESAILVNVGRGPVVDEAALYQALSSRRIYGAGIDVWYVYPPEDDQRGGTLPASLPFWELDNVVMTPHSANDMRGWRTRAAEDVMATLEALTRGEERNLVDPRQGY
ncbi:MAG TPA: NAD(P)-dependent oxidoreductase [Trueperaceae bacterium]